jgi:hypothetical protein
MTGNAGSAGSRDEDVSAPGGSTVTGPIRLVFQNDFYDGQLARTLSASYAGMADLGEAFAAAHAIGKPTPDTWHAEWNRRAEAALTAGDASAAAGQRESARSQYLRASEYFRQSFFFLRHNLADPRLLSAYHEQVAAFQKALPMLDAHGEAFAFPYDGTTLKAYRYAPDDAPIARPTMLFPCGYDSTAEEGWTNVPAALARGYNAVTFEGPGQGAALYEQGLFFRPDFDAVLTPLIDQLAADPRIDLTRLVLVGRSFAGYLAPQAATVEHRIAALICDPAQPDMAAHLPTGIVGKVAVPAIEAKMRFSPDSREFFGARMAAHGLDSPADYLDTLKTYTMLDQANEIRCPTLIVECEGDPVGGGGAALASAMGTKATLKHLSVASGAGGHCGWLGQQVWDDVVYGWLGETLSGS